MINKSHSTKQNNMHNPSMPYSNSQAQNKEKESM